MIKVKHIMTKNPIAVPLETESRRRIMTARFKSLALILSTIFVVAGITESNAKSKITEKNTCSEARDEKVNLQNVLPLNEWSKTEHVLKSGDLQLRYSATTGVLPVNIGNGNPECRILFINYDVKDKKKASRPLVFVFNGGPGASSAYLHLAALGPERIMLNESGSFPTPPGGLRDNIHTWLRFTDLVFIDPVGTGYSRCLPSKGSPEKKGAEAKAWGVREDLTSLAKFIRLYLTRTNRWLCPKFIAGESYGGFRVGALSDLLQSEYGIALNGVVLVSPALEFSLLRGDDYSLLPWIVNIPSYTATARYHGKAEGGISGKENLRMALKEAESFALNELLPALAVGDTEALNSRLGAYIGLSADRVARMKARIPSSLYVKALLRDEGRLISLYDGSFAAIDPDPQSPLPAKEDPLLIQLNTLLTAGMNSYVREQLKFETDISYEVLNKEVSQKWNWKSGLKRQQGFVGVAESLKRSMSMNKDLKAFIAHGVFDLITPYFGSVIITGQMSMDPAIASNLTLKVYEGGHMFYTHAPSREMFFEDARRFFQQAVDQTSP
jgi:carboxypeptidase C (cathepsin A)